MSAPDWYADWRHDAVHELMTKADKIRDEYSISKWPRYDYDVDVGIIKFSQDNIIKVVADIQVVGTIGSKDWLWSWANDHWPDNVCTHAQQARDFGEEHGIEELTSEYLEDENLNSLGWEMAAVTARIAGAVGAYRPPSETGALFLLLTSIRLVS
jgi:hypothetical protein